MEKAKNAKEESDGETEIKQTGLHRQKMLSCVSKSITPSMCFLLPPRPQRVQNGHFILDLKETRPAYLLIKLSVFSTCIRVSKPN